MAAESKYEYTPSIAAAAISIVIFVALLGIHNFPLFKTWTCTRTWFCIPFVAGTVPVGRSKPAATLPYIIQALSIPLAPILFATSIFISGDVLCFLVQAAGGGILAGSDSKKSSDLGKAVILTGLCLQMAIFAFFVIVAAIWQKRMVTAGSEKRRVEHWDWVRYLRMLYTVSGVITARNLFRVIEYAMGEDGYLLSNEWPIYVFDAALMAIVLAICSCWYVGDNLKQPILQGEDNFEMLRAEP
ncbi:hypothetical protein EJ07DRAFT_162737 [Lizonia empirigonia]|nr:hypothetical protein EJ07DRAFT_162737 [Lizonia empirigonia]